MVNYSDLLHYWFLPNNKKHWFNSTPAIDEEIREKFESLWSIAYSGELDDWRGSPKSCLALIIILDQLPLNMFRGHAKCFLSEKMALELCHYALLQGYDKDMHEEELVFLLMPLGHSETMSDQKLHLELIEWHTQNGKIESQDVLRFANHHHDLVEEFGRFPHRNAILGRKSTPQEVEYLASDRAFTG